MTTPAQLGDKVRRELLARNLRSAARDLEAALRRRGVHVRPDRVDGMAALTVLLTVPEAAALIEALGAYADALEDDLADGPRRTRQQKMADCLLDLVLRPGKTDLPTVRAQLTLVAPVPTMLGGDQPGEIGGEPVPAELVRALAHAFALIPDDPEADSAGPPAQAPSDDEADDDEADDDEADGVGWGGEEDPPLEELERWWALEAVWTREPAPGSGDGSGDDPVPIPPPPVPGRVPDTEPSWWAAADRAVDAASATLLALDRQLAAARRVVETAQIADATDRENWEHSPAGRITAAPDVLQALAHASREQRAALARLLDATGGGGLVDRPRIAVTDALTGALLALTDARQLRARAGSNQGLGPPSPSPGHRPGSALDRHVRARDRRCRQPGCRNRVPRGGELDHHVPWPDGPTAAGNLTGFCTSHHRGKHQAPGWRYDLDTDATLTVRTPSGLVASTGPPPF